MSPAGSRNVQDADKVVQDALNDASMWDVKDADPNAPISQRMSSDDMGVDPQYDSQSDDGGNSNTHIPAAPPADTPLGDAQEPYFKTDSSVYHSEAELRKGVTEKDAYIKRLRERERDLADVIKRMGTTASSPAPAPAPAPAPQLSKEEQDANFEKLVEVHGQRQAITIIAEQIATDKLAARDHEVEQERQIVDEYVADFRRANPNVSEGTIRALRARYTELSKDTNLNPLAVLYNPGVAASQLGNGGAADLDGIQDELNANNEQLRDAVNRKQKMFIPKSPHSRNSPANKAHEIHANLADRVREGDYEGATNLAFAKAAETRKTQSGQQRR